MYETCYYERYLNTTVVYPSRLRATLTRWRTWASPRPSPRSPVSCPAVLRWSLISFRSLDCNCRCGWSWPKSGSDLREKTGSGSQEKLDPDPILRNTMGSDWIRIRNPGSKTKLNETILMHIILLLVQKWVNSYIWHLYTVYIVYINDRREVWGTGGSTAAWSTATSPTSSTRWP